MQPNFAVSDADDDGPRCTLRALLFFLGTTSLLSIREADRTRKPNRSQTTGWPVRRVQYRVKSGVAVRGRGG